MKKYMLFLTVMILLFAMITPSYASRFINKIGNTSMSGSYNTEITDMADDVNQEVTEKMGMLYKTLRLIAIIAAVIATTVVGISYITAESGNKKAELKTRLEFIVVGLFLALAATYLVEFIATFWEETI